MLLLQSTVLLCRSGGQPAGRVRGAAEYQAGRRVLEGMSLILLIVFALATILPCLGLWAADQRERLAAARV